MPARLAIRLFGAMQVSDGLAVWSIVEESDILSKNEIVISFCLAWQVIFFGKLIYTCICIYLYIYIHI